MSGTFNLTVEVSGVFADSFEELQILVDDVVVGFFNGIVTSEQTYTYTFTGLDFGNGTNLPDSLKLRFKNDTHGDGRTMTIESLFINGRDSGVSSSAIGEGVDYIPAISGFDHLFGRIEPVLNTDFGATTISGTAGNDDISGGSGEDVIDAGDGNDRVRGLGADDAISGGDGNDVLHGEGGNDVLLGGIGDDSLFGEIGDDILFGQAGADVLRGGAGDDVLNGGAGNDTLRGDAGNDILYGEAGNDILIGGGSGANFMYGDGDDDRLVGGSGTDTMYGGSGDDTLRGKNGDDFMWGGTGEDLLMGGTGTDYIYGEDEADRIFGEAGDDFLYGGDDPGLVRLIDDLISGGGGNDYIEGGSGHDMLFGGAGNDEIHGGDDNDVISGHGLSNKELSTILRGNAGVVYSADTQSFYKLITATVNYSDASGTGAGSAFSQVLDGINGHLVTIRSLEENDVVQAVASSNVVYLGASDSGTDGEWRWADSDTADSSGGDRFWAGDDGGTIYNSSYSNWDGITTTGSYAVMDAAGTWDSDTGATLRSYVVEWELSEFTADAGDADKLYGDDGDDTIYGHGGNDEITGGIGNDILYGGSGDDIYFFERGDGNDIIIDSSGTDEIRFGLDIVFDDLTFTDEGLHDMKITLNLGGGSILILDHRIGSNAVTALVFEEVAEPNNEVPTLPPSLDTNSTLTVVEAATGGVITTSYLDASDGGDTIDSDLIYTITTDALYGQLKVGGSNIDNGGTFTQADLVAGDVTYDHDGSEVATDSFAFTLSDGTVADDISDTFSFTITAVNDGHTGAVTVDNDGSPAVDETLTANTGALTDPDGIGAFTYQWYRNGSTEIGTNSNQYTLVGADETDAITVKVTWTDAQGFAEEETSVAATDGTDNIAAASGGGSPTTEDDIITGDGTDEVIDALAGDDTVNGGGGNDTLIGGTGNDTLNGDAGNDTLWAVLPLPGLANVLTDALDSNTPAAPDGWAFLDGAFGGLSGSGNVFSAVDTDDKISGAQSLQIYTSGSGGGTEDNISGAWQKTFNLATASSSTLIDFSYKVFLDSLNDDGEGVTVYASVDNGEKFLIEFKAGDLGGYESEPWVAITDLDLGALSSGNHTIELGLLQEKRGASNEWSSVNFDDVVIDYQTVPTSDSSSTHILNGGTGEDELHGSDGTDTLSGGDGNDTIYSGSTVAGGNLSILTGGDGVDTMYGSGGQDRFKFDANTITDADIDIIHNFTVTGAMISVVASSPNIIANPAAAASENFGFDVDISGIYSIAGSPGDGEAYVYNVSGGGLKYTLASSGGNSVAINGTYAVVGDIGADSTKVFNLSDGSLVTTWGTLAESGGDSVAVTDNYIVVGDISDQVARVYNASSGALLYTLDGTSIGGNFGFSVAVDGNYAVIGANLANDEAVAQGTAHVYNLAAGDNAAVNSSIAHVDNHPRSWNTDNFGWSVDIDADNGYVVVGAYYGDGTEVAQSGTVFVFDLAGSLLRELINPDQDKGSGGNQDDNFGSSVSIDGNYVLVGTRGEDDGAVNQAGSFYIYDIRDGNLEFAIDNPDPGPTNNDNFGWAGAMDDGNIIIGAPDDDPGSLDGAGSVFAYEASFADADSIDITDVLFGGGYDGTQDLSLYLQLTESTGDTQVWVDKDGAGVGAAVQIGLITGVTTGLTNVDVDILETAGTIITGF